MDANYLELVEDAIDCWDTSGSQPSLTNENIRRFEIINEELVDGFPKSPAEMKVSRRGLKKSIKSLIKSILDNPNPKSEFKTRYGSIIGGYMSPPFGSFSVGFPLNMKYGPDKLEHDGFTIHQMDRSSWMSQFEAKAKGHDDYEDVIDKTSNSFKGEYTYWKFDIEANDRLYVANKTDQLLQVILGELIYCLQHWSQKTHRSQHRLVPYAWSELKHPFIYIILKNNNYEITFYDEDPHSRVRQTAPFGDKRVKRNYKQIPSFDSPNNIEQSVINSFKNLHRGTTEHKNEQAFFHLWRAIENLALTEDGDSSLTVLSRAVSVIEIEDMVDEFGLATDSISFEDRIKKLKDKRNNLVHEGAGVEITDKDLELLRLIYCQFLPFMIINRKWTEENIIFWLENVSKDDSALQNAIQDREATINDTEEEVSLLKRMRQN